MRLEHIYGVIAKEGFSDIALQDIRQQALQQVAMLKAAKEAQQTGK